MAFEIDCSKSSDHSDDFPHSSMLPSISMSGDSTDLLTLTT